MNQFASLDKKTEKYHFIAIGGSIMHNLAIDMSVKGHIVTGSDDRIYNPAKKNLKQAGLLPDEEGWYPEKITQDLSGVILGMHAKADNPELAQALKLGIPVYSFPEFVFKKSQNKLRIVVAGSHGKTSISSMIMHLLGENGMEFDYLVGASLDGYDRMVQLSDTDMIVIEGDEYLSSRIDPRPKFMHYKPDICVLSGIAWDHMNVFPTYHEYLNAFAQFVNSMPQTTKIIYNMNDTEVVSLIEKAKAETIPYTALPGQIKSGYQYVQLGDKESSLQVFGYHNLENLGAAASVGRLLGLSNAQISDVLPSFSGAAMRLEKIYEDPVTNYVAFRDFAHAPSKVRATVRAVRELLPDHRLVVLFELHTFSSVNAEFIAQYRGTLADADRAGLYYHESTSIQKGMKPLTRGVIKDSFNDSTLEIINTSADIEAFIEREDQPQTCILLMSSGRFGGIDFNRLFSDQSRLLDQTP